MSIMKRKCTTIGCILLLGVLWSCGQPQSDQTVEDENLQPEQTETTSEPEQTRQDSVEAKTQRTYKSAIEIYDTFLND